MAVREEIVFSYIGLEPRRHMFMIKARIGEEDVGYISVRKGDVTPSLTPAIPRSACYQVAGIEIDPKWRRRGIGTALYEEAARITAEAGYALCSDTVLSQEAEEFWVKQTRKGRAKWEVPGPPEHEGRAFQYGRYVLDYPPPPSLSGRAGVEKKTRWYHCSHPEGGERILAEGYRWKPTSNEFKEFFDIYIHTLPSPEIKGIDAAAGDYDDPKQIPKRAVKMLQQAWDNMYGEGTAIWVADEPRYWYGTACFEVDLPEAEVIYEGDAAGALLWVPWESIPAERFVPLYGPWGQI